MIGPEVISMERSIYLRCVEKADPASQAVILRLSSIAVPCASHVNEIDALKRFLDLEHPGQAAGVFIEAIQLGNRDDPFLNYLYRF